MDDFESIYLTATGGLVPEARVPWVKEICGEGTPYAQAYRDFWDAREHLTERFPLEWEDEDLERIMNGIMHLEREVARQMFLNGIEYAKRGYRL